MSDRWCAFQHATGHEADRVELFRDGETGTWRLFVSGDHGCDNVDFTLEGLRTFARNLQNVLELIKANPEEHDAERRRQRWML